MTREEFLALMFTHMIQADGELAFKVAQVAADYEREACYRLAMSEASSGSMYGWPECAHEIAKAIRARGEV